MKHTENEIYELIDNMNSGEVNAAASYDEGVHDALLWILGEGWKPMIGRE